MKELPSESDNRGQAIINYKFERESEEKRLKAILEEQRIIREIKQNAHDRFEKQVRSAIKSKLGGIYFICLCHSTLSLTCVIYLCDIFIFYDY